MEYDYLCNITIIGDSGNGKSSLINRFVSENEFISDTISTIGVDYRTKIVTIDGKKIKVHFWDTAGQERFNSIVKSFYRNSNGIILTFDLSNKSSFNNLEKWMKDVNENIKKQNTTVILVGTKSDLVGDIEVTQSDINKFTETHGITYFPTSSKKKINVLFLLNIFVKVIVDNMTGNNNNYGNNNSNNNNYDVEPVNLMQKKEKVTGCCVIT